MVRSVVVVTNLKGGVGKTTTAVYLAAAARRIGQIGVAVVDADPQASSAEWLEEAPIDGVEILEAPTTRLLGRALDSVRQGTVILDTPPGTGGERIIRAALERADTVVIPTRAGGPERTPVQATLELIPPKMRHGLVICGARTGTRDLDQTVSQWQDLGEEVWATIPERVAIASGRSAPLSVIGLVLYDQLLRRALGAPQRRGTSG